MLTTKCMYYLLTHLNGTMNIFILDKSLPSLAQSHCDKHVNKMATEAAQLASTARAISGRPRVTWQYLPAYAGHPCTVWAAANAENLAYTCEVGMAICDEYSQRYHRQHASYKVLANCRADLGTDLPAPKLFALAIKEPLRRASYRPLLPADDAIAEYRAYYIADKSAFAKWPEWRGAPSWWPE